MGKIRFIRREHDIEIRAIRKDTGKWDTFGFCHPASVTLIKRDGIKPHIHLIRIP